MHRVLGIGLLAFFSFVLAGIFPAQWVLRQSARREMQAMIRSRGSRLEGVVDLAFRTQNGRVNAAFFHWEEEDEEFSYRGVLYDVVSVDRDGEGIIFHCIEDGREERILQSTRRLAAGPDGGRSPIGQARLLVKFMCEQFLQPQEQPGRTDRAGTAWSPVPLCASVLSGFRPDCFHPPAGA